MNTFRMSIFSLVMPCKLITFTVHNYLTKRDYTYSIDDICDLGITCCAIVWIVTYYDWSSQPYSEPWI